ncbi:MAG: TIGR03118 family protein [Gaiellaceae bacterium]
MGAHRPKLVLLAALVLGAALVLVAPSGAAQQTTFTVTKLVSDQPGVASNTDPDLVNAWGLVSGPTTPWWVSDNGTNKSTLYRGSDGAKQSLIVTVAGGPTGVVFNSTASGFQLGGSKALFLFDTENGLVRGWNSTQGTTAARVADRSDVHAVYKGLALADTPNGPRLFAADFHNRRIDVFDTNFALVPNSGFADPSLPKRFAPFNVQVIGSRVFVSYAKQDEDAKDDVPGPGHGFVDVYDLSGNLLGGIDDPGLLNSPWAMALAPAGFPNFAGDLLVGNFGDGRINAYAEVSPGHFQHVGKIRGANNDPLVIDGLWALQFGQGGNNGPAGTLFFTAGPDGESHGLFGQIVPN